MSKIAFIIFISAFGLNAEPIWEHPNLQVALPSPTIAIATLVLDRESLEAQSPQTLIWYDGGLIGYFFNVWSAPIWTTPNLSRLTTGELSYIINEEEFDEQKPDPVANVPEPGFLSLWWLWAGVAGVAAARRRQVRSI